MGGASERLSRKRWVSSRVYTSFSSLVMLGTVTRLHGLEGIISNFMA